jgi:hypothetical protein
MYEIDDKKILKKILITVIIMIAFIAISIPVYRVWQQGLVGRAELARAQQNKQIKIAEAEATKESSYALAQAEIIRAEGVAKANKVIGDSLKNNEAYLRYLYVNSLADKDNNVYYIPTEAGLPILEAGNRKH